jgi:mRNA-degrading endonuclease toxin of MazEF toxin-antitoxin module
MENPFDRWNDIKKATDAADEAARLYFREGEIWWVRLGKNIGYETDGKSREFTRPVIILKKTTSTHSLRCPSRPRQSPTPTVSRSAWLTASKHSQRSRRCGNIDSKRLVKKIVHLDADMLAAIKKEASRVNFG